MVVYSYPSEVQQLGIIDDKIIQLATIMEKWKQKEGKNPSVMEQPSTSTLPSTANKPIQRAKIRKLAYTENMIRK